MTDDDITEDSEEGGSECAIAMVATSSERLPSVAKIKKACGLQGSLFERVLSKFGKRKIEEQWNENVLMLECDDSQIVVVLMPGSIPWSQLEGPCATAWWWPDATEAMQQHKYHFIAMVRGGEWNEVARRVILAGVIQGVLESTDAVGVYWGDATLVMQPELFIANVRPATIDDVPMMVFADVRVEEISDGVYRCFTTGMESLGFHEIEVDETTMEPDVLMEFILDSAKYIVDNYLEIPEGNTFGRDAHKQFKIHYRPSMFDRDIVMKFDLNQDGM
jgi:hypothetical protein